MAVCPMVTQLWLAAGVRVSSPLEMLGISHPVVARAAAAFAAYHTFNQFLDSFDTFERQKDTILSLVRAAARENGVYAQQAAAAPSPAEAKLAPHPDEVLPPTTVAAPVPPAMTVQKLPRISLLRRPFPSGTGSKPTPTAP